MKEQSVGSRFRALCYHFCNICLVYSCDLHFEIAPPRKPFIARGSIVKKGVIIDQSAIVTPRYKPDLNELSQDERNELS